MMGNPFFREPNPYSLASKFIEVGLFIGGAGLANFGLKSLFYNYNFLSSQVLLSTSAIMLVSGTLISHMEIGKIEVKKLYEVFISKVTAQNINLNTPSI